MKKWRIRFQIVQVSIFVLLLLPSLACSADPSTDEVLRVVDGDTVILKRLGRARLIGVDAPEIGGGEGSPEYFGIESSAFADRQLAGQPVRISFDRERKDRHGRVLVYLYMADGTLFNSESIRQGFSRALTTFPFRLSKEFLRHEIAARANQRGLWAQANRTALKDAFHGNIRSRIYHAPNCEHFNCPSCTALFDSELRAFDAGFTPHWDCVRK